MRYVDGYVVPVPKKRIAAYRSIAQKAGKVWRDHGALEYVECVAEDVKEGKVTSFPQSVNLEDGETVVFAWITFESREERDRINAEVMKDRRMAEPPSEEMQAVMKRMVYGGFEAVVDI